MKEAVFVHYVNVGSKSPQRAKELIHSYMESVSFEITLPETEVKNIVMPITEGNGYVECIYPVAAGPVGCPGTGFKHATEMNFSKVREVKSPERGTPESAGIDFYIPEDFNDGKSKNILPNESAIIPAGIKVNVPEGYALIAFNKSGIATKKDFYVGACVVDEDYQGEVHIHFTNVGKAVAVIQAGDKIMQFILIPVSYATPIEVPIEDLYSSTTERGTGGFGSTDKK